MAAPFDFDSIHEEYMSNLRKLQHYFSTPEKPVTLDEAKVFLGSLSDQYIDQLLDLEVI